MEKKFSDINDETVHWESLPCVEISTMEANYFQGINERKLIKIANEKNLFISFLYKPGTFLIKGSLFMLVYCKEKIDKDCLNELLSATDFFKGQPIDRNADYGFNQLAEVAIKALSPGINDPATAVISLHALSDLFSYRLDHRLPEIICDHEGKERIYLPSSSFDDQFEKCINPIWNYGKKDEYIQNEIIVLLKQLKKADHKNMHTKVFDSMLHKVNKEKGTAA